MSAFNSLASSIISNTTSAFDVAGFDVASAKPDVVAGLKAVQNVSFGNDAKLGMNLNM